MTTYINLREIYIDLANVSVVKPVCVSNTHSEPKQTETLEFGAGKGLLQGPRKENG